MAKGTTTIIASESGIPEVTLDPEKLKALRDALDLASELISELLSLSDSDEG